MGLATNLTLFMICLSFVLFMFGVATSPLIDIISCYQSPAQPVLNSTQTGQCQSPSYLGVNLYSLIGNQMLQIGTAVGIVAAVTVFGSTTVFSIIGLTLFGLATFPLSLLSSEYVPYELKLLVMGTYGFGYIVAMISWLKIGGTP